MNTKLILGEQYNLCNDDALLTLTSTTEPNNNIKEVFKKYNPFTFISIVTSESGNINMFMSENHYETHIAMFSSEHIDSYATPYTEDIVEVGEHFKLSDLGGKEIVVSTRHSSSSKVHWSAKDLFKTVGESIFDIHYDDNFDEQWLDYKQSEAYKSALYQELKPILEDLDNRAHEFFNFDVDKQTLYMRPFDTYEYCDNWFTTKPYLDRATRELYLFYRRGRAGVTLK